MCNSVIISHAVRLLNHVSELCSCLPCNLTEALWNVSKSTRTDEKEREHRRDIDANKEKDRYKEKYWGKSIQELDLSNCQRCTPSYRLLPDDVSLINIFLFSFSWFDSLYLVFGVL